MLFFNPLLATNFSNMRNIITKRHKSDPKNFNKTSWQKNDPEHLREWISEEFNKKAKSFPWNDQDLVPVLACVHGTDGPIAWKICSNGFSALASLDSGWYGRGIYFTSNACYAIPYFGTKKKPTILIALVIPGNIFPVTENKSSPESLQGKPLTAGYQSHYVHTMKSGDVCIKKLNTNFFDELVIPQETQVLPLFLLSINVESITKQVELWHREVATEERKERNTQKKSSD